MKMKFHKMKKKKTYVVIIVTVISIMAVKV